MQAHEKHIDELLGLLMTPGQSADARRDLTDAQAIIKELQRTRDSLSTKLFDAQLYAYGGVMFELAITNLRAQRDAVSIEARYQVAVSQMP